MRIPFAYLIDRHPRLRRAQEVLSFADARARDVRMGEVAGSLTFTTLLSIVPLFAVALALFTAFPLFAQFRGELENFLLKVLPGQISSTVMRYVNEFAAQATRLTALGVAFLAVTALSMIITVDRVLNDIWRVRDRRPLTQRVLIYWAIITLGPILIGASLSASSFLWSLSADAVKQLPRLLRSVLDYAPLVISGFAYAALYVFVPNRNVAWRDALIGGFIAAVLAELVKGMFGVFVSRGSARSVYGAFAVLPLFLIWVYLSWYVLLFGAAIAATLPRLRATRFSDETRAGNAFVTAVGLLKALFDARVEGRAGLPTGELARAVRTTPDEGELLLESLERLGYVRRAATTITGRAHEQDWLLVCDTDTMTLAPLFNRFAVDPTNTLLSVASLGLGPVHRRWSEADWLQVPLQTALGGESGTARRPAAMISQLR
jgi:membrane protein